MTNLTLELFNAVESKISKETKPYVSKQEGLIIMPDALWAKNDILNFYQKNRLDGNSLNKTFYQNWEKVKNLSLEERFFDQIFHYMSTYGTNFQTDMYIPNEQFGLPKDMKLKFKVVFGLSKEELITKSLDILKSGIALKEETIDQLINLVHDSGYVFTGKEGIKNKEAIVKIADLFGAFPDEPQEFLRYLVFKATDQTLLIKNDRLIKEIKSSNFSPVYALQKYDLKQLAEIFNRFKPIFLAFKRGNAKSYINKISRLSKTYHKPLVANALNEVTQRKLEKSDMHWLENATPYALFKALNACNARANGQSAFLYQIRNGRSWAKWVNKTDVNQEIASYNLDLIVNFLQKKYDFSGKKFYIPKNVEYALPSSEKMFVGNVPVGSRFYAKRLAVGVYWENAWGARDLDLSAVNIGGKVGWNASYNQNRGALMHSGDITNATNGAVEYLRSNGKNIEPSLVMNNVFSGDENSGYKIIIGKGEKISREYMMQPKNLFVDIKTEMIQKQVILGLIMMRNEKQCFVLMNSSQGNKSVSSYNDVAKATIQALYEKFQNFFTLNDLIELLGGEVVKSNDESVDYNFSLEDIQKDSFISLF